MALDMHHTLTLAYGVMGFVALVGYVPQMRALWSRPDVCATTPIVTWTLWTCQTVVFFLYSVIANGDPLFMFNSGMFMLATIGCLTLIIRGRRQLAARSQGRKKLPSNVVILNVA